MPRIKRQPNQVPDALKSIDVKGILRRRKIYTKLRQNVELKEAALPMATVFLKNKVKKQSHKAVIEITPPQKYLSFADEIVEAYKSKAIHNAEILEKHFDAAINNFLVNTVMAKVLENLSATVNDKKGFKTKAQAFDEEEQDYLVNQATIQLEPYLQNMAVIAGQDANSLIGLTDPYIPSEALRKRIGKNVNKFTKSMIETDQQHLSDLIVAGIDAGSGVPEIASSIKGDFVDYSANQATLITRTEVLRSANQSAVDAFKQSGVVEGKQWVIAGAEDECADYDGEIVGLDNGFYGGDSEFQDGDPPLHPNCKCIVVPVLADDSEEKFIKITNAEKHAFREQIKELEAKIDKRTTAFKKLKAEYIDDKAYIKSLEKYLGDDEPSR